ncbi:hypothetical protein HO173_004523 [Letharia columbiana]|uniref:COX assembly mitochondrial protein n=1 Tax=Letharia columbiana TaxID=112416 RepID=A0A8H6L6U4_9LECA|nr:uncharacterized protein HO173_004523 [Letharia columbiana]KAF6237633.1 hypothetical protein HO173_004523 [Letharia columbiana]
MMARPKPESLQSSPVPSRNPLPLSAAQESQVRDLYYKKVRGHCANEIRDFASCATNRTISATWACRKQRLAMNSCMIQYASQKEQDAAREEWFANMDLRRLEMEEKRRQKVEAEKFFKEWWDIPKSSGQNQEDKAEKD